MTELPLVFTAGLLGSSHCLGMCGPFAIMLSGGARNWRSNVLRQLTYSTGRIFTYATLGSAVGFLGMRFVGGSGRIVLFTAALAIVTGTFLVLEGARSAGWFHWPQAWQRTTGCFEVGLLRHFLSGKSTTAALLAGVFTGFLPCGLVYAFLALAAQAGDAISGGLTMAVFGLGTVPMMLAAGVGGRLIPVRVRQRVVLLAACCVMLTGFITIARGVGYLQLSGETTGGCPMCQMEGK